MKIECLASGSSGNCFLLYQKNEIVALECGLGYKCIVNHLTNAREPLNRVSGVLCTHSHKDHSQSLADFQKYGFQIYCPITCNVSGYNVHYIENNKQFKISDWLEVMPFSVNHDTECYGFVLHDLVDDTLTLFITDTGYIEVPFKFLKFDRVLIECNHIKKALDKCLTVGCEYKYIRQARFHLSLKACKHILKTLDLSKCKEIHLIHFSKELGYPELCKKDIEQTFPKVSVSTH